MAKPELEYDYAGEKYPHGTYTLAQMSNMTGLSKDTIKKRFRYWGRCDAVLDTPLERNKNKYKKVKSGYEKKKKNVLSHDSLFMQAIRALQPCQLV